MGKKGGKIEISLNNIKLSQNIENDLFKEEFDTVKSLIKKRLNEIDELENKEREYEILKMQDSIFIDGARGRGKTTFLRKIYKELAEDKEFKNDIHIFDIFDLNHLSSDNNILQIILATVFNEMNGFIKESKNYDKREKLKELRKELLELNSIFFGINKLNEEEDYERFYILHKKLNVAKDLHKFFKNSAEYFGKKIIILFIDDLDMNFTLSYEVLEILKSYFLSPRIIPIVALDSSQIYGLVKKKHYEYFSYEAKSKRHEIEKENGLIFLKKLPLKYLQKILRPSRKIILPDMLQIYKNHLEKDIKIFFVYKKKNINIRFSFKNMLKFAINILYGGYISAEKNEIDDFRIINYLKNKSIRSFLEDMYILVQSIEYNEKDYIINRSKLKNAFHPYSIEKLSTKYDAAIWVWDSYIKTVHEAIEEYKIYKKTDKGEKNFIIDLSEKVLDINGNYDERFMREDKTYMRLFLQDFFIDKITLFPKKNKKIIDFDIEKTFLIEGILELVLRVFIPMIIFEELVNAGRIEISTSNFDYLKKFASNNIIDGLQIAYKKFIFFVVNKNEKDENKERLSCGIKFDLNDNKYEEEIPITSVAVRTDYEGNVKEYINFFNHLVFIMEASKVLKDIKEDKIKKIKKILNHYALGNRIVDDEKYLKKLKSFDEFKIKNSSIGILSMLEFSKMFSKNFTREMRKYCKKDENNKSANRYIKLCSNIFYHHFILLFFKCIPSIDENIQYDQSFVVADEKKKKEKKEKKKKKKKKEKIYKNNINKLTGKDKSNFNEIIENFKKYYKLKVNYNASS